MSPNILKIQQLIQHGERLATALFTTVYHRDQLSKKRKTQIPQKLITGEKTDSIGCLKSPNVFYRERFFSVIQNMRHIKLQNEPLFEHLGKHGRVFFFLFTITSVPFLLNSFLLLPLFLPPPLPTSAHLSSSSYDALIKAHTKHQFAFAHQNSYYWLCRSQLSRSVYCTYILSFQFDVDWW